ncbi:MAG: autotransporter-associated beta strand repeat-containing protein [Betaproteobacteria bacterium]|nr:autotransporter-associated beta strand repeat-containing protein [Betaproteobacteria bacterium]
MKKHTEQRFIFRPTGVALAVAAAFSATSAQAFTNVVEPPDHSPVYNETVSHGQQDVRSGGEAYNTTVNSYGTQSVRSGGTTTNTTVNDRGTQIVAGEARTTTINAGGQQTIVSGGLASGATIHGGQQAVEGGTATGVTINSGGEQRATNAGIIINTIMTGGWQRLGSGSNATNTTLWGGTQEIDSNSVAITTIINGARQNINASGEAKNTTINSGGVQNVNRNGKATSTILNSGSTQNIDRDASATNTTINAGSTQNINANGQAYTTVINSGGAQNVNRDGKAETTTINSGGVQNVDGLAEKTTINSGGVQNVHHAAHTTTINAGGQQTVYADGSASYTTINAGVQDVYGGWATSTTINSGGVQNVYAGSNLVVSNTNISAGGVQNVDTGALVGSADIWGGGTQNISAGASATDAIISSGGVQNVDGRAVNTDIYSGGVQNINAGGASWSAYVHSGGTINAIGNTGNMGGTNTIYEGGVLNAEFLNLLPLSTLILIRDTDSTQSTNFSGSGNIVKQGSGTLTLTGDANFYFWHGGITVREGTLSIDNTYNLGTGTNTLEGGTLRLAGGPSRDYNQGWALGAGDNFIETPGGVNAILNGSLTGTGGFTKTGDGTLTLRGSNQQIGDITVSAGTLSIDGDYYALGTGTNTLAGATLRLQIARNYNKGWTLGAGDNVIDTPGTGDPARMAGALIGTGGFTKTGEGTLTLTGANTYSGATIVREGTLAGNIASNTNLSVASGATYDTLAASRSINTLSGAGSITNTGGLTVNSGNFSGDISGGGGLTKNSGGGLYVGSFQAGNLAVNSGGLYIGGDSTASGVAAFANGTTFGTSRGFVLTANNVTIGSGATVDLTSASFDGSLTPITVIKTNGNTISGGFDKVTVGGVEVGSLPVSLERFITAELAAETRSTEVVVTGAFGLVWNSEEDDSAHGHFNVGSEFTLDANLANNLESDAWFGGWDGKKLTKTGAGTLILTGANTYTGGTVINAGTLSIGSDANIGATEAGRENILGGTDAAAPATLRLTGTGAIYSSSWTLEGILNAIETPDSVTATMSGNLTGAGGGFEKTGEGRLILTGTNTYSGGTTVSAGILAGDTTSLQGNITNNAGVEFNQASNGSYTGVMSGTGQLAKGGAGTLTLAGDNSYSGDTVIQDGSLTVTGYLGHTGGSIGAYSGNIIHNGTNLTFNQGSGSQQTLSGVISGSGSLTKSGDGILILTGVNDYGSTTVNGGALSIGSDANIGAGTNALNNATLMLTGGDYAKDWTLTGAATIETEVTAIMSGVLGGAGGFEKTGAGTLILTGTNTYTGGTTVSGGALSIGSDANIGATGTNTLNGGTLRLTGASYARDWTLNDVAGNAIEATGGNAAMSGVLGGAGGFTKSGGGELTLSGANTYSGDTTISGGTLEVTGTLGGGSYGGAIVNNGALTFNQTANQSLSGDISGSGLLTKSGSGALTLAGNNSGYSGDITVRGGTLNIGSDANLGLGTNTLAGGTLSLGAATYSKGWTLGYMPETGLNVIATTGSAAISGNLTGDGGFIKNGAGTLTLEGDNDYKGVTIVNAGTLAGNIADNTDLTVRGGATYSALSGDRVINTLFGAGAVNNTGGGITVNRANFSGNISGDGDLTVSRGNISGAISITGDLTKNSGDNLYIGTTTAGNVTVNAGGLYMGDGKVMTASGHVEFKDGTTLGAGFDGSAYSSITAGDVTISEFGATIDLTSYNQTSPATPFTVITSANEIVGNFSRVTVGGAEVHTEVTIDRFIRGSAVAAKSPDEKEIQVTLGGFELVWNLPITETDPDSGKTLAHGTFDVRSEFTLGASLTDRSSDTGNNEIDPATNKWEWDGKTLTKTGHGVLIMTGTGHGYGDTIIKAGTLSIGSDANIGIGTNILDGGTLLLTGGSYAKGWTLNAASNVIETPDGISAVMSGALVGDGGLRKAGEGALTLGGNNTYEGDTIIVAGNLTVTGYLGYEAGAGGSNDYGGNIVNNGGSLTFRQGGDQTLSGSINGNGGLEKDGGGALILTGNNGYMGSTTISDGALIVEGTLGNGTYTGNITNNAELVFDQSDNQTLYGSITGSGSLTKDGAGTLFLFGDNNGHTGDITVSGGKLGVTSDRSLNAESSERNLSGGTLLLQGGTYAKGWTLDAEANAIETAGSGATMSGVLDGAGGFTKTGNGELILGGNNTYEGDTIIGAGSLTVTGYLGYEAGTGGSNDYGGDIVNNGGSLTFRQGGDQILSGEISGAGALVKDRAGTLEITGSNNTYTGLTAVMAGTLAVGDGADWNISDKLALHSGATLDASSVIMIVGDLRQIDVYGRSNAGMEPAEWTGSNLNMEGQTVNFHMFGGQPDPVFLVNGADANIIDATIGLTMSGYLFEKQRVELLQVAGGDLEANDDYGMRTIARGTTMEEVYGIWKDGNSLYAGLENRKASDKAKAYSTGFLSGVAFLNQGSDLVSGQGMFEAVYAADPVSGRPNTGFAAVSGGKSRYKTGSHSDVSGVSLIAGASWGQNLEQEQRLTLGVFMEYGNASYDSYNSFARGAVDGNGDVRHYGIGALGRLDLANGAYTEGSFRMGNVKNKFSGKGFGSDGDLRGNYKTSSMYFSAHLGAGHALEINEKNSLDLHVKYLWTRQGSDSVSVAANESVDFKSVNSHRVRLGGRFNHDMEKNVRVYAGLAYEYEFDAKAKATAIYTAQYFGDFVNDINAPSLKGSTGIAEFGVNFKPSQNKPLFLEAGLQGYVGKREGITGSLRMRYEF